MVRFVFLPRFQPVEIVKPFLYIVILSLMLTTQNRRLYFKYFLTALVLFTNINVANLSARYRTNTFNNYYG